jgi:hypothetical protein
MYHVILDPVRETLIKLVLEGGIAPLGEKRELVEFNDVGRNPVAMFHVTEPDAILRIPNQIVWAKIHGKLLDKDRKVSIPSQNSGRIVQIGSEPLLSSILEIRNHEKDFVVIGGEILHALGKMKIALGEEQIKFGQIGSIKGVQVLEIRLGRTRSCGLLISDVNGVPEGRKSLNKQSLVGIWSSRPASRTCWTAMITTATSTTWGALTITRGTGQTRWSLRTRWMRRFIVAAVIIVIISTSVGRIRRRRSTVVRSWKDWGARLLYRRILHNFLKLGHKNGSSFHSSRSNTNWMRRAGKYRWMFRCLGCSNETRNSDWNGSRTDRQRLANSNARRNWTRDRTSQVQGSRLCCSKSLGRRNDLAEELRIVSRFTIVLATSRRGCARKGVIAVMRHNQPR